MKKYALLAGIASLTMLVSTCANPAGGDGTKATDTSIHVTADITAPTTWVAGAIYRIMGDISVSGNLVVQPGAVVAFDANTSLTIMSGASFSAIGNSASRIRFTTSSSNPAAGQWKGIFFGSGAVANSLAYCDVEYAGSEADAAISFHDTGAYGGVAARANLDNCHVSHNLGKGIAASRAGASSLTNNHFYANSGIAVSIDANVAFDATNHFHEPGLSVVGTEKLNCIEFCGDITTAYSLVVTEVPYFFPASFSVSGSLTIAKGVVVKMGTNACMVTESGATLYAVGDALNPIIFTSYKDSASLGDSNGLGTAGAAGQWGQIYFDSGSIDNVMGYCTLMYAGFDGSNAVSDIHAIQFHDVGAYGGIAAQASLSHLLVEHNYAGGINAEWAASASSITDCAFLDNAAGGALNGLWDLYVNGATASVSGNAGVGTYSAFILP